MNTDSPNTQQKTDTLFGGRIASVLLEDGSTVAVKVRQLRLGEYERAFGLLEDEFAFTAFCCQRVTEIPALDSQPSPLDKNWALTLQPESYELLQGIAREVNEKGFFSFATRRINRETVANEKMYAVMAKLPPEVLKTAAEIGAGSTSSNSSRQPRPR